MKILITGAASGIGYNAAIILANQGHHVYLTCENTNQVEQVQEKIKSLSIDNIECFKLDITDENDRNKIIGLELDALINNAALGTAGSLLNIDTGEVRKTFEVNFFSTIELSKLFIENYSEGNIVVTSSLAGIIPIPFLGSYSASKAALIMFFTILHQECLLNKKKIRIKLVEPGLYKTGFNKYMLDYNRETLDEYDYQKLKSFLDFEESAFNLMELNRTTSIAKKVAQAATSKTNRLKYRRPIFEVIGAKIYMLLFK